MPSPPQEPSQSPGRPSLPARLSQSFDALPQRRRGILLCVSSAFCSAFFLIPYRRSAELSSSGDAVVALLLCAAVFNSLLNLWQRSRGQRLGGEATPDNETVPVTALVVVSLALLSITGNLAAAEAVVRVPAAVASVLLQTQVLFVTAIGWLWLSERVGLRFVSGALVAVVGVGLMRSPEGALTLDLEGTLWGLGAAVSFGMVQVVTRRYIHRIRPVQVNALRLWLSVAVFLCLPGRLASFAAMPPEAFGHAAVAAFVGPFVARLQLIFAARHVPAALATLLGLLSPPFTVVVALVLIDEVPSPVELLGGAVVLAGTFWALGARSRN